MIILKSFCENLEMKQKLTLTFCGIEVQNPELGICSIPLACLTYFMKINPPKK
jgi:hypothetical protein